MCSASRRVALVLCVVAISLLTGCVSQIAASLRIASLDGHSFRQNGKIQYVGLFGTDVTDEQLASLVRSRALRDLKELNLGETKVTDSGLACLGALPHLQDLWLQFTEVGDAGMEHVAKLQDLRSLDLRNTPVTDLGVAHLIGLKKLSLLAISGTKVTDAVVLPLSRMPGLRAIHLADTAVTPQALARLRKKLSGLSRSQPCLSKWRSNA